MFILLKLLLVFFRPLVWVFCAFLYALFTKNIRRRKRAFIASFALLFLFTNPFIITKLIGAYEVKPVQLRPSQTFKAGILLGGLVSYDPGEEKGYFNNASDRFIQTALLFKQGHLENIIVAAGNGYITKNNFSEAGYIKDKLVQLGIPAAKIFTDAQSRNTLENAQLTKRLTDSFHFVGPYLLISSAMHLRRAEKVFQKAGISAVLYPSNFLARGHGNNFLEDYLIPSSQALTHWENLIKELVGLTAYYLTGKV